ncbi:hypothetical protein LXL04_006349 [Taraxacum kok-saghyz]
MLRFDGKQVVPESRRLVDRRRAGILVLNSAATVLKAAARVSTSAVEQGQKIVEQRQRRRRSRVEQKADGRRGLNTWVQVCIKKPFEVCGLLKNKRLRKVYVCAWSARRRQKWSLLNVHRCLVVFLLGTPDSTTNPNQRCHLLPSPPSRPEPHPTTAAIPIPGLSCSCGTTDLHLPPFSIAAGVGSSTIADAVGEENRRPSPPNLHHPLVYSSGDHGAANQFHRHLPPSLSVSLSLPDSCCQRRKATFTIELEASPSLKNTSTTVASPTRLHLGNRTADLLFFPSSEIGPGRGVDRVPSLVPDSNRFHAC